MSVEGLWREEGDGEVQEDGRREEEDSGREEGDGGEGGGWWPRREGRRKIECLFRVTRVRVVTECRNLIAF